MQSECTTSLVATRSVRFGQTKKRHPDVKRATFPIGTVVMKLLFTDVPIERSPSWEIHFNGRYMPRKTIVRQNASSRKSTSFRWISWCVMHARPSGGFLERTNTNGALNKANKWENLVPVGIQWGNDPGVSTDEFTNRIPAETKRNP